MFRQKIRAVAVASFGLSAALLFAPRINSAKPSVDVTAGQKCTVSGTVLSVSTGQPLNDSVITMNQVGGRRERRSAVTNAAGRFEFKDIDQGRYFLTAEHTSYIRMEYGQRDPRDPAKLLTLWPGQRIDNISFQLIPEAVITGHVYDEDGNPLEHSQIFALRYRYLDGTRRLLPAGFATTDDRGRYRIYDLAPDKYYVSASANPLGPGEDFVYGPSYYPGVEDASQASPITLRAGSEFPGVDLTLQRVGVFHIRGRVISSVSDLPLANMSVRLVARAESFASFGMGNRVEDARGDFDIPSVRPGTYFLVTQLSVKGKWLQARQQVTVMDSDVDGIRLELTSGATLKGIIRADGSLNLTSVRISLRPSDGVSFRAYISPVDSAEGTFDFNGLADGSYLLRVFGLPPGDYVKSATLGGQNVLDQGFEISNGGPAGSALTLFVSSDGGSVRGSVMLDGKPLSDALVTLLPADSSKLASDWWFKSAATDENGDFALSGVRPGDYRVFAWQKIDANEEHDPAFLDNFRNSGQEIQVAPRAMFNLHLQLNAIPASQTQAVETP